MQVPEWIVCGLCALGDLDVSRQLIVNKALLCEVDGAARAGAVGVEEGLEAGEELWRELAKSISANAELHTSSLLKCLSAIFGN